MVVALDCETAAPAVVGVVVVGDGDGGNVGGEGLAPGSGDAGGAGLELVESAATASGVLFCVWLLGW